jgi:hypothetical protein
LKKILELIVIDVDAKGRLEKKQFRIEHSIYFPDLRILEEIDFVSVLIYLSIVLN